MIANAAVGFVYWQSKDLIGELQSGEKKALADSVKTELNVQPINKTAGIEDATTILAIGSDIRHGETGTGRSDTIIVVRIDPKAKTASMLSIPRDMRVNIPGHGFDKINAAYSLGGSKLVTKTVREFLGVPINHFVEVDFHGFSQIITDVGGVYIPVDQKYYNPPESGYAEINLKPGYQLLSGSKTLSFVRFRHQDSDFYRAARQQLFIKSLGSQIKSQKSDIGSMRKFLQSLAKSTTSDIDSLEETFALARTMQSIPDGNIKRTTLEGSSLILNGGDYLQASPTQVQTAIRSWAGKTKSKKPAAKKSTNTAKIPKSSSSSLIPDGGKGKQLSQTLYGVDRCAPTKLPVGYNWPSAPSNRYRIRNNLSGAMYATKSSGNSILWMWTEWQTPPILASKSFSKTINGKRYDFYTESGKTHVISWKQGKSRAWVSNTLRNEVSNKDMEALATSCL